jgi:hypothetical protein
MDSKEKLEQDEKTEHQQIATSDVSDDWESEEVKRKLRKI